MARIILAGKLKSNTGLSLPMIKAKTPSLETNFLPLSIRKGVRQPVVVFDTMDDCAGCYYDAGDFAGWDVSCYEILSPDPGIIVVDPSQMDVPGAIAHEWRHHWQYTAAPYAALPEPDERFCVVAGAAYRKQIVRYFVRQWWEFDALRFQMKYAPCDVGRQWHEWITRYLEPLY